MRRVSEWTTGGAAEAQPGSFFVDGDGAVIALPGKQGQYVGRLMAHSDGASVMVRQWGFRVVSPTPATCNSPHPQPTCRGRALTSGRV